MGEVIALGRRHHVRGLLKLKQVHSSNEMPRDKAASRIIKKYRQEMEPRFRHRLTKDAGASVNLATGVFPPSASISSAAVVSIASVYSHFGRMSTALRILQSRVVNYPIDTYVLQMARHRKAVIERLSRLQAALGFKRQREMAHLAGISEGNWSEIMALKRDLPKAAAQKIKDETGVTLDWIMDGDVAGLPLALASKLRAPAA